MALKVGELFATLSLKDNGFAKSLSDAQNKASTLNKAMESCVNGIRKYESSLSGAKSALKKARESQSANNAALQEAQQKHAELEEQVKALESAIDGVGGAIKDDLTAELKNAKSALKDSNQEIKALKSACAQSDAQVKKFSSEVNRTETSLNAAKKSLGEMRSELNSLTPMLTSNSAKLQQYSATLDKVAQNAKSAAKWQNSAGSALTLGITTPVISGLTFSAKEAIDFEDAFAGVEKTVDATVEQFAKLQQAYINLSEEIPVTKEELASIGEMAGQLGIKYDAIEGFTEVIANLNATTNLTAEEGAASLAKFANITGMEQTTEAFESMASAIVDLGNNSATTEADIVAMAMRLAGAGHSAGMNEADILGISTALSSLGIEAEMGGSAFSRLISEIQVAVETGSNDLNGFAEIAGMTAEQFAQAFRGDAAQALSSFIVGLGSGTESATVLMQELGITELRLTDALRRTSNASGLFTESIQRANSAWAENTAMVNEANKRYNTFASRLKMTKNKLDNAAMSLGEALMPTLESAMEKISGLIDGFAGLDDATKNSIVQWGLVAASIGPALKILAKMNSAIGLVSNGMSTLVQSAAAAGGGLSGFGSAILSLLKTAIGPAGIALSLGVAVYGIYKLANANSAVDTLQEDFETYLDEKSDLTAEQIASVTVLPEYKLSEETETAINNVYNDIKTALTDGKPDTEGVINGLKTDVSELFSTTRENIETWYNEEMAKLDLNTEDGIAAAIALGEERDKLLQETATAEEGTFGFISTYAGASTELVKQHVNELDTLVNKITQINTDIETQRQLAESVQRSSFNLVVKGQANDNQSIANALNFAFQSWSIDTTKLTSYTESQMLEATKAFDAGGEVLKNFLANFSFADQLSPNATFSDWEALFSANQDAQMKEAKSAYLQNIQSIIAGIASTMGADGEQLKLDLDNLGIAGSADEAIQSILSTLTNTPLPEMSAQQRTALVKQVDAILAQYAQVTGEAFSNGENLKKYITDTDQTYMVVEMVDQLAQGFNGATSDIGARLTKIFQEDTQITDAIALAIQSGMLSDLDIDTSGFVQALQGIFNPTLLGPIGDDIGGGIGQELADHDYSSDAETSVSNLESDLGEAAQRGSPAKRFFPLGNDIAAGIGAGMQEYSFDSDASVVTSAIKSSLSTLSNSANASGYNFARGLANGIRSGKSMITAAAREVAQAAANAANNTLNIHSPSKLMEQSGKFFDMGFAKGITGNMRPVANAASGIARLAADMASVRNPGAGLRNITSGSSRPSSAAPIDYDAMASAMNQRPIYLTQDGRIVAAIGAKDNITAQNSYMRSYALAYGK